MDSKKLTHLWDQACTRGLTEPGSLLVVSVETQRLYLLKEGRQEKEYVISTSKKGTGTKIDSYQTPTGWHEIVERYGDNEPAGRVFFEREPTDEILPERDWKSDEEKDLVMTRILRLGGLEKGINQGGEVDTYERYVYFHGANHEHRLGTPVSHGCIHLSNHEIIDLYHRLLDTRVFCWIG